MISAERVKTPHIGKSIICEHKEPHEGTAGYRLIQWLSEHIGEWVTRSEMCAGAGIQTRNIDSILADVESNVVPFILCETQDRLYRIWYMAMPKD